MNLILVRHGQSIWNRDGRFTGWVDIGLTDQGVAEAIAAGRQLHDAGIAPDVVFTSLLSRAIATANLALEELDRAWIPVGRSWRLNERHYGALAGLDRNETIELHGPEQVRLWRRSFTLRPPLDERAWAELRADPRYADVADEDLPAGESLADVQRRLMPYFTSTIAPQLAQGKTVLIAAHGNSLRALVKHLEQIDDDAVINLEIPTGEPRAYLLGENLAVLDSYVMQ